jgi:hypothetical protein
MSDYANIITQAQRTATVPGGIYGGIDYHGSPPWELAMAAGWRKLDELVDVTPPDGFYIDGWEYTQDEERTEYALEWPKFAVIPVPVPERFAAGIDAPLLVLDAPDGSRGVGYAPADDGTLLPILYAHASPYDMEAVRAKVAAARADYATRKTAREAVKLDVAKSAAQAETGANGSGNSVALLRAEVARIAVALKKLTEGGL